MDERDERELYDEALTASMPYREEQWRELEAYVAGLGEAAESRGVYPADFSSEGAYLRTIEPLREKLRAATGYPPPGLAPASEARMQFVAEDTVAKYYRCWVDCPPLHVYGLYLVPQGLSGAAPLVIAQHGGGGTPETAIFEGGANYHDMVRGAAERGYVVFAPHLVFNPFSDREADSPLPAGVRQRLDARLRLLGTTLTGVEVAKLSRALDVLLARPEVDPTRVAMIGLSYGGYYTLHATAVEPRIKVAVSSCYFNDQSRRMPLDAPDAWSDMRFPGTLSDLADAELVALACPRPLQVQVGKDDPMFLVAPATRLAQRAGEYYEKLGVGERFEFAAFDGGHEWWGEGGWRFLEKWL